MDRIWKLAYAMRLCSGVMLARRLGISIGRDCRLYTSDFGSEPFLISMGDRVIASVNVLFLTHDAATALAIDSQGRRYRFGRIDIGSDVFIGARSIILPGVEIGDKVIIGAGSIVTRSIPRGSVVAGNPARFICSFDDYITNALKGKTSKQKSPHKDWVLSLVTETKRPAL